MASETTILNLTEKQYNELKTNGYIMVSCTGGSYKLKLRDISPTPHNHTVAEVTDLANQLAAKANTSDLATVATSGSYNDLTNKPTIPQNCVTSTAITTIVTSTEEPAEGTPTTTMTIVYEAE